MILIKSLFFLLLVVNLKCIHGESVESSIEENSEQQFPLANCNTDLRGLRDIWEKIRESAISSWNYVKELAQNTQQRIGKYVDDVRDYAEGVRASLQEQLQKFRERLNEIIEDLYGTRELVSQCVQRERETIEQILRGILKQMSDCIMNEIKNLIQISGKQSELSLNDTEFMEELENKFKACENDLENIEECMNIVRKDVLDDVKEIEDNILKTSAEVRGLADDVKNTIVTCSMNNVADASYFVGKEVMEIAKCVLEGTNDAVEENITSE